MLKYIYSLLFLSALSCFTAYAQTPTSNPDLSPSCPMDVIFILDESGSIAGYGSGTSNISASVRSAASNALQALVGTNSRVAIIEFNTRARRALVNGSAAYQVVDAVSVNYFLDYINDNNTIPEDNHYDPEDYLSNTQNAFTNWEDALQKAQAINSAEGIAQLVLFFTDGVPTAYNNSSGGVTQGSSTSLKTQALNEAIGAANILKGQGSHIFVIGVPNAILPETNVQSISGTDRYPDLEADFIKGDYSISTSQMLQSDLTKIGLLLCRADLRLAKTVNTQATCAGSSITFTLTLDNDGLLDATGVQVKDYLPSGYNYVSNNGGATFSAGVLMWNAGNINYRQTKTLQMTVTVNASGNYINVAEISASDQPDSDSSPNNGVETEDDYAFVNITSVLDCDDGNPCTVDGCLNGICTHTGGNCNDNDPCTEDACVNGECVNIPKVCNDNNACTNDLCLNGNCIFPSINCSDGDNCTTDACSDGVCSHTLFSCDDGNPCTTDICAGVGCRHVPVNCNDNNACTTDGCVEGDCVNTPVDCDDGNPQSTDVCQNGTCQYFCDDGDGCTNDTYQNGQCVFTPVSCNDGNLCTTDTCVQGSCVNTLLNCDDGDPNTTDICVDGICQNNTCNDNDACTSDAFENGTCVYTPVVCNDNEACTDDVCQNGECIFTPKNCEDGDLCTFDACVNGVCIHDPLDCDDGNPQTSDACVNGSCVYTPIDCDAGDPLKILFIMDESGSIAGFGANTSNITPQVRAAATGAIQALEGTNTLLAIIEFNSTARRAVINGTTDFQPVTTSTINYFFDYINDNNNLPDNTHYDPEDYLSNQATTFTNWEDALEEVQLVNAAEGQVPLILFFTDGFPTAYNNALNAAVTGSSAAHEAQALAEAAAAANIVKAQGSHIFVIGVPNPVLPESKVQQISGPDRYPDMQLNFIEADYSISTSQTLETDLTQIGSLLCRADLRLTTSVNTPVACAGASVVFTITVMNQGLENTSDVQVRGVLPDGFTYVSDDGGSATTEAGGVVLWNACNLNNAQSKSLQITALVNASGNHKLTAEVIASAIPDGDSTPNNDDGDQSEDDEDAATVTVNCDCDLKVSSLTLMWECTLGEIGNLFDGKVINRDTVCRFNIRADLCQLPVGSVKFAMNGIARIENTGPYAYYGDQPAGCYKPWIPNPGNYTLVVTAYSGANATGTAGVPLTVHFTVVAGQSNTACLAAPTVDCAGKVNGTAFLDNCGICSGGTSGHIADSDKDNCGVCFGNNSSCCVQDTDCNDNSLCTTDNCVAGNCVFAPINIEDGDICTDDACSALTGIVSHTAINCDDNNFCTTEYCTPQTGCVYDAASGCCQTAADCNDNNPCTTDACTSNACEYTQGGASQPSYLKLTNTGVNYQKIRLAYSSSSYFSPKVNVTVGGNNQMCLTLRDPLGTVQWNKIRIRAQGSGTAYITLSNYVPANPGTDWFTVCIPLNAFPGFNFTQISYMEFANNGAGAFEVHVQRIEFIGGSAPFLWFGDPKIDNLFDMPTTSAFTATLVSGQPCGTAKLSGENQQDRFILNQEEFSIHAYPNPFKDELTINYVANVSMRAQLEIISVEGKRIALLFDGLVEGGVMNQTEFVPVNLTNGMYFCRITTGSGISRYQKILLMR